MRRLLGPIVVSVACCSVVPAADPTPEDAIKLLKKLKARYRMEKKGNAVASVDLARKKVTDNDLRTIAALKNVKELNLAGPIQKTVGEKVIYEPRQVTDAGLKYLAEWTELRELSLDGTHVTDEGLKHLAGMTKLQRLILSDTKVTDAGMEHLKKLTALRDLSVLNTKVTDSGVGVLKRWKPELRVSR
jgi:Leucine Rich Repeat (LRR) protein